MYIPFNDLLLAHMYDKKKHNIDGWYASEKLDGVRAYWDGKKLWSKQRNIINAPEFWIKNLPKNHHLDGELYIGRKQFEKISSIVRKKEPIDDEWKMIKYYIFDIPSINKQFKDHRDS